MVRTSYLGGTLKIGGGVLGSPNKYTAVIACG